MVRCLVLLLGLSLVAFAGGQPSIAQGASDTSTAQPAQNDAPAKAADTSETKSDTPAPESSRPAAQADAPAADTAAPVTPALAPVVVTPPAQTPAPAAGAPPAGSSDTEATAPTPALPVVDVPAMPAPKPILVETAMPRDRPEISERTIPARLLFGAKKQPSTGKARAIGYYPKGCLAGGVELPIDGPTWQAMRLSRNRNWGHPDLVRFVQRFASLTAKATGWPGVLVGDLGQPRGGPTPFGHKSHQTGLDVDIWFGPMPDRRLSKKERETMSALNLVSDDWKDVNPKTWTPAYAQMIRVAAEQPEVQRVLVNAAIKKELCRLKGKQTWRWMAKVRPWYAHHDHIHVRLKCPSGSPHCRAQPPVSGGEGCGKSELAFWFSDKVLHPKPKKKGGKRKETLLADLPPACKTVLNAPARTDSLAAGEK
jgi:penicillin-insensitive murein endopeptidase